MKETIKIIGIVAYKEAGQVAPAIEIIVNWAQKHPDFKLHLHSNLREFESKTLKVRTDQYLRSRCDLVLALGGDGTFLSAARLMSGRSVPLLGVNLGRLGFLSDVAIEQLETVLDRIKSGSYTLTERMMLNVKVFRDKKIIYEDVALNDVVFTGNMGMELIDLYVEIQGKKLTDYWVDGLIICTPTGSTAYSLSAGGPIIYPVSESVLITPINPKPLSIRPIIIPASRKITVKSEMAPGKLVKMLTDGRHELQIEPDDSVQITKHRTSTRIIRPRGYSFLKSIRNKLGWRGR